jgi:hypothetical protein
VPIRRRGRLGQVVHYEFSASRLEDIAIGRYRREQNEERAMAHARSRVVNRRDWLDVDAASVAGDDRLDERHGYSVHVTQYCETEVQREPQPGRAEAKARLGRGAQR